MNDEKIKVAINDIALLGFRVILTLLYPLIFKNVGKWVVDMQPRPYVCFIFFRKWNYNDIKPDERPRPCFWKFEEWLKKNEVC